MNRIGSHLWTVNEPQSEPIPYQTTPVLRMTNPEVILWCAAQWTLGVSALSEAPGDHTSG
jgi:hypothetical protein